MNGTPEVDAKHLAEHGELSTRMGGLEAKIDNLAKSATELVGRAVAATESSAKSCERTAEAAEKITSAYVASLEKRAALGDQMAEQAFGIKVGEVRAKSQHDIDRDKADNEVEMKAKSERSALVTKLASGFVAAVLLVLGTIGAVRQVQVPTQPQAPIVAPPGSAQ